MIHFDLPRQKSSIIKVLGVGGGGSNAVNFMHTQDIEGVDFIICNTDSKALEQSNIANKIQLGPHLTQGLGAGANPEVGKQATEESLEEIRRILEVNTRMAFITAGMGGGTGTGGAPIVAQICREMGILTVGIVTTPFGFEGPRRMQQAEEGIRRLQPYVDTLLVISNDKLRQQYGNLKLREAFAKADDVLATAAKCITDIINSRGHIIVDFADVCTVMKNGGVAILGSAEAEGEDRAMAAIEQALNSPLLNDNDISGAKWILININSAEGDYECTMDEINVISQYVREQAGATTDVIVGMGFDPSLDKKVGITLIATGFDQKDPFAALRPAEKKPEPVQKIVMTLADPVTATPAPVPVKPAMVEELTIAPALQPVLSTEVEAAPVVSAPAEEEKADGGTLVFELDIHTPPVTEPVKPVNAADQGLLFQYVEKEADNQRGFLSKPATVYAAPVVNNIPPVSPVEPPAPQEVKMPVINALPATTPTAQEDAPAPVLHFKRDDEEETAGIGFVIKEEPATPDTRHDVLPLDDMDEDEIKKRMAQERMQRLRNLSFNMNSSDANAELDNVPAYVRRNMELFGTNNLTTVEDFYSKYTVKKEDEEGPGQISTINTFLDGKKPD